MPKPAPASVPYDYLQQQPRPAPYVAPAPASQPPLVRPKSSGKKSYILEKEKTDLDKLNTSNRYIRLSLFFS